MNSLRAVSIGLVAVLTIALATGCASQDHKSATGKSIESLSGMKASVTEAQAQVDRLLGSMNAISSGNDLANSYKTFNSEVAELRKSGERAAERAMALRDKESENLAKWQDDMGTARDSAQKAELERRKAAVRTNYERARVAGQSVRQAYGPLNGKLTDVQRRLSGNLTPDGVAQVRPVLDQARREAQELKNRLATFVVELDRMQATLMSGAQAK